MGIRLARISENGQALWGVVIENQVKILNTQLNTLHEMLKFGKDNIAAESEKADLRTVDLNTVEFLSPVTWPSNVVCQGANYSTHREESGLTANKPPYNLIFNKAVSSLTGANSDIVKPENVEFLDYEIEVGLVLGTEITESTVVNEEDLSKYIAGIVIVNDVSARDVQILEGQWYKGKSYRTFGPTGPYIYLLDGNEYNLIEDLEIQLWVNDELRQSANTNQLLFKPAETLTELSGIMDFNVGDLIITGTTGGVAMAFDKETLSKISDYTQPYATKQELFKETQGKINRYLKAGDSIKCSVKSTDGTIDLGELVNTIV